MTYLSVQEAAKIAGKNERTIRRWIRANKIKSSKIRGKFHVDEEDLFQFVEEKTNVKITKENKTKMIRNTKQKSNTDLDKTQVKIDGQKMSGKRENDRYKIDQSPGLSEATTVEQNWTKKYDELLIKNNKLSDMNKALQQDLLWRNDVQEPLKIIKEGEEYILSEKKNVRSRKMSDFVTNNMSVKILPNISVDSQEDNIATVEMSDLSEMQMSSFGKYAIDKIIDDTDTMLVSEKNGHLSTKIDMPVDNIFDDNDTINSENPIFDNYKNNVRQNVGHIKRTSKMSDYFDEQKNIEAVNLSGYAVRLMDEKEKVISTLSEENKYLKIELNAATNEIKKINDTVGGELINRAAESKLLINNNIFLQEKLASLTEKTMKIAEGKKSEEDKGNNERLLAKDTLWQKIDEIIEVIKEKNNQTPTPNWSKNDARETQKIFLTGIAAGMIIGLIIASTIIALIGFYR